jgi:AraC-like DNA-binding protein
MLRSATFTFDDPVAYQAALRGAEAEVLVTGEGDFRAEYTYIHFDKLLIQDGFENLPCVSHTIVSSRQAGVLFSTDPSEQGVRYCGIEVASNAICVIRPGSSIHVRTSRSHSWAAMTLPPENLASIGGALTGRDLTSASVIQVVSPQHTHMARLFRLHAVTRQLSVEVPDILAHQEVASALEHRLIHAMVTCLNDEAQAKVGSGWRHHTAIINRFEEVLAANCDRPMYLAEICTAVGASERVLRSCCEEHLGMGPIRYLWLRRMHLARSALLRADPAKTTVTQIATDHGFLELGRFSVAYHAVFGESPSASLNRPLRSHKVIKARPFSLADSDFA